MDQKPTRWHHCQILKKHNLLGFDSFVNFSFLKLIFKCVNNLAPEILSCQLINKLNSRTRGAMSGNCRTAKRKTTFGQSSFVAIGTKLWNTLPSEIKTNKSKRTHTHINHIVLVFVFMSTVYYVFCIFICG